MWRHRSPRPRRPPLAERPSPRTDVPTLDLVVAAARAADDKKGEHTLVLDVSDVLSITGWFVITSGSNTRLVKTITEEVEERVAEAGGAKPLRIEGLDGLRWVLMDYGDFVVHVFLDEERDYYELERLWSDVPRVEWATGGAPVGG